MRKNILYILITFAFISLQNNALAADDKFYHIDASNGLTNLYINTIAQDDEGFIWIGTENGLFRYDGYEFKSFMNEIDNEFSLSSNEINHLFVDSKGTLWVSTSKGLNLFNSKKQIFHRILSDKNIKDALPNILVETVFEDSEGIIWVGTFDGFSKLKDVNVSPKDFKFENWSPVDGSTVENWINNINEDIDGNIWFAARYRGLYKFNKQNGEIIDYHDTHKFNDNFFVSGVIRDSENNLWVSSFNDGFFKYDNIRDTLINYNISVGNANAIHDIIEDDSNRLWLATNAGVSLFDYKKNIIKHYHYSKDNKIGLSSNEVLCMYKDRSGIIWFGHRGQGIDCYMKPSINVQLINSETNPEIPTDIIGSLAFINDKLFFSPKFNNKYEYYNGKAKAINADKPPLLIDRKECFYGALSISDLKLYKDNADIFLKHFKAFGVDKDKNFYFEQNQLLLRFDKEGNQNAEPCRIYFSGDPEEKIPYIKIKLTDDDKIAIMEKDKIYLMSDWSGKLELLLDIRDIAGFKHGFQDLYIDGDNFWIIANYALYNFNITTKTIKSYNENKNFGDIIFSMIIDNDKDVWMTTNKGIVYLYEKEDKYFLFDKSDGIPTYSFSEGICKTPENVIYFASSEGIIGLEKKSICLNNFTPPIVFTSFKLFNKEVPIIKKNQEYDRFFLNSEINETEEIVLKYNQNHISIEFSALNYKFASKNQYSYRLEGFSGEGSDWKNVGNQRVASFIGLPPGEYIFKVKASNNDGIWNESARSLRIIIRPPFWQTLLFKILVLIFVLIIVLTVFGIRIRAINKQKKELEKQVRLRTAEVVQQKEEIQTQADNLLEVNVLLKENQEEVRAQSEELFEANTELQKLNSTKDKFFSIIAHDLKNPFQAINGFSEVLLKDFDKLQKDKTKEFIGFISNSSKMASSLLENLLEWARTQTNRIKFEPDSISIYDIANETIELLKVNAKNKDISLINNISEDIIAFADKNMINTVLRNLLNNAIKYTPKGGKVTFSGKSDNSFSEIIMEDTGVGMDEKTTKKLFRIDEQISTAGTSGEAGTGLGLIICKEFIEKNNGSIEVESEIDKGSKFTIKLPVGKNIQLTHEGEKEETTVKVDEPINEEINEIIAESNVSAESSVKLEKPIVIVAEDTLDIRAGIKAYIESDFKVIEAEDGEEALKYAIDLIPDLIITDWMMPKMDGIELCDKLKTNSLTSHIPIIMLTAKSTSSNKIKGFETGADEYITKPFDYSLLKVRIKNLIITRKNLQKKYSVNAGEEEEKIKLSFLDQEFMDKLILLIEQQLDNSQFNIDDFSKEMGMSRAQLYRKVTAVTGQSPVLFLRNFRLKKAADLLKEGKGNVSEVMYQVGFNNSSYFARSFREVYNCSPSEYAKK